MSALISLDGTWQLATDPDNTRRQQQWQARITPGAVPTQVPGIIQDPFPAYHGVAWYCGQSPSPGLLSVALLGRGLPGRGLGQRHPRRRPRRG
ncbi:MAG: hypothetical protein HYW07_10420 [Candidatus Latescibacteria bacterium]|nr:hypothetical protein [Candidatus Latescibacterota bacterium]